jgi:hypothetical protein
MSELETRYSTLFGTKTSKGQLQLGFFILGAGALLGIVALGLYLFGTTQSDPSLGVNSPFYDWAKPALTLAPLALAGILMGISVALPTRTGARTAAWIGLAFCVTAAILFWFHYPKNFNVAVKGGTQDDWMALDVLVFVAGAICMMAAIVTSVIGYYLGRLQPAGGESKSEEEDIYGSGYEVPDWVVERDIEEAMKRHGVSWGEGVRDAHKNTLYVNVADSVGGNMVVGGLGKAKVVHVEATQVDEATAKLSGTRGHKRGALPGEWADESVAALVAFRKQKAANPKLYAPKRTFWQKVGDFFTGRGRRVSSVNGAAPARVAVSEKPATPPALPRRGTTVVIHDDEPAAPKAKKGHK